MKKIGVVSLGCAKNLVDSEILLGKLRSAGARISDPEDADIVIVNTCGFITPAKMESIIHDTLLRPKREKAHRYGMPRGALPRRDKEGASGG